MHKHTPLCTSKMHQKNEIGLLINVKKPHHVLELGLNAVQCSAAIFSCIPCKVIMH